MFSATDQLFVQRIGRIMKRIEKDLEKVNKFS
jgi:hypothetical protein